MKFVLVLACIATSCLAAPPVGKDAEIVKYEVNNIGVDGYDLSVETSDGTKREEKAFLKNAGTDNEALEISGFFSYLDSEGKPIRVDFVANENGYQLINPPKTVGEKLPKKTV